MKDNVFEFKQKLTTPAQSLCLALQKAFNASNLALVMAQAIEGQSTPNMVAKLERSLVSIKYDAQMAEKAVANMGETLIYRQCDFSSEAALLARRRHALNGELCAIEAQLICARSLAEIAVQQGLERPESEISFLMQKMTRKESELEALQSRIAA